MVPLGSITMNGDRSPHGPGYKIGYARVSTLDQNLALQLDALKEAGCEKIFVEQMSGAVTDRPVLCEALEYSRKGDTLIVWKLDRLARSMKQLIETQRRRKSSAFLDANSSSVRMFFWRSSARRSIVLTMSSTAGRAAGGGAVGAARVSD
jgi:hypothetical protein